MAEDRTIDENARTELDSGPVARPNFTQPLGPPPEPSEGSTRPRPGGAARIARRSIGRFRIDAELGSGGMADVFRAYDPMLDRDVALKVLHAKLAPSSGDSRGIERVLREARAAAALAHPNTVTIYEVGEADGEVFIAMELLRGKVLREVVAEGGTTLEQKLAWLLQAARALAAAHARGLVHRDVKPENMFVCEDGTLKLLDFGIAKRDTDTGDGSADAYPTGPSSLRTQAGRRFGTPRYMAPEQHAGRGTDARTDEYAWGLVAFELLCGSLVVGEHPTATAEGDLEPAGASAAMRVSELRSRVPGLAEELITTIARATEPKQSARFPSMTPIVEALERLAQRSAAVPVAASAKAPTVFPSTTKWLVAAAIMVGAVAVLLGTSIRRALSGPAASSPQARTANTAPPLCHVTSTRTATRAPRDFVVVRSDGALVTVRNDQQGVAVGMEPPDGGAARALLPYAVGGGAAREKVQWVSADAFDVRGDPDVFVGLGMADANGAPQGGTALLLGSIAPRGVRRFRTEPSGFAAIPFGPAVVGAVTTQSDGIDVHGVTLFKLGVAADPFAVEDGAAAYPALAATKDRFGLAYHIDDQIRFALYGEGLQRFGDILTVTKTSAGPALAFADEGKTAVVYYSESLGGKQRLLLAALTIGEAAFHPPVTAIDDPLLDAMPMAVRLPGGAAALAWIKATGDALTIRLSPVGPGGVLSGPTDVATAAAVYQLHGTPTAKGLTLTWNDGTGTTTIADVQCQLPVVKTPAR